MRKARPTPNLRVTIPCRATIGHTAIASTMKNSGYACGPALLRKIDCAALKAVYIAQPSTIAKPATCRVRFSSVRRTCRNFASSGDIVAGCTKPRACIRSASGLLYGGDPFQGCDSLLDGRVGIEQVVEE